MKRVLTIAAVVLGTVTILGIAARLALWIFVYDWVVGFTVRNFGIDPSLARGLAWFGVAFVGLVPLWALLRPSRQLTFASFVIVGTLTILGWWATRDNLFTRQGQPIRYIAITTSGLVLSARPGVDRKTGTVLKAVSSETAPLVALWLKTGGIPPLQTEPCSPAFSALNGKAMCWYEKTANGILFSRLPGYSPRDGEKLRPVTHAVIDKWEQRRQVRRTLKQIMDGPTLKSLRVTLVAPPPLAGGMSAKDPPDGTIEGSLSAGTLIPVKIAFHSLRPESVGADRLTPDSLAVRQALGLFPGQAVFFRVPVSVYAPNGEAVMPAGSSAEGFVAVSSGTNGGNQLLVSITAVRLFLPGRHHPIPMIGHLASGCPMPLMNQELCRMVLDASLN